MLQDLHRRAWRRRFHPARIRSKHLRQIIRMHTVHILFRSNGFLQLFFINMLGQRTEHQNPVYRSIVVQFLHGCHQTIRVDILILLHNDGFNAQIRAIFQYALLIGQIIRVCTHTQHGQLRGLVFFLERFHTLLDILLQFLGNGFPS
jgi:hypothetical protein